MEIMLIRDGRDVPGSVFLQKPLKLTSTLPMLIFLKRRKIQVFSH